MKEFPCICGHSKENHNSYFNNASSFCDICYKSHLDLGISWTERVKLGCNNYVSSNLKYLEQIYEKSLNK